MTTLRSVVLLLLGAAGCAQVPPTDPALQLRREQLRGAGVKAPLTLFPVRLLGRADADVAEVLGLVLERRGMAELDTAGAAFDAGELAWDKVPDAFGKHVRERAAAAPAGTAPRHALYAEFLGDPRRGPTEVRFVVVDARGEVVFVDRQTPADAAFQRTAGRDPDPLGCAQLVADRLFALADWRPVAGGVPDGRFAARWQRRSGAPDRQERAAMQQRTRTLRAGLGDATFAVFAPVWPQAADVDAARLSRVLQQELAVAKAAPLAGPALVVPPGSNQQKRLFDLAAAARAALADRPIDADYAVAVELALVADGAHGFANVVVLDRQGALVLAEFVNDQHELFRQRAPKTLAEGEQLVVAKLRQLLR